MTVLQLNPQANENAEVALARARQRPPGPVLIAGGGIGGLATALALARHGIASHVLERRPAFHEDGAGIQIGPNGTRILRRLGVADALRPLVGVPEALRVRDGRSGAELARLPLGRWIAMRHGAPYWVAHRKDLHSALLHASRAEPLIALSMGFDTSEVASDAGHVAVAAENGQAWSGKALIAADGIWSPLRKLLFGGPAPKFCGKSAVRSVIPLDELPADFHRPETTIWLFRNAHVVHYPVSGGAELAVVVVLDDRHDTGDWSTPVSPSWVQQNMPPCAEPLQALILAGARLETVGAAHAARAAPMDARVRSRCSAMRRIPCFLSWRRAASWRWRMRWWWPTRCAVSPTLLPRSSGISSGDGRAPCALPVPRAATVAYITCRDRRRRRAIWCCVTCRPSA